jgi:hypothetical protein
MPDEKQQPSPEVLDDWAATLAGRFGLAPDQVPVALILDHASDAAHGVSRPAAPLSAFVAGLVAGRGDLPLDEVVEVIRSLALEWGAGEPGSSGNPA